MSKKIYTSRPPNFDEDIPAYFKPPMTVEEYQYYEREFFGFLNDKKDDDKQEEAEPRFVQQFKQLIGLPKSTKYEDTVPAIKFNVHEVLRNNEISNSDLNGAASATVTKPAVVETESKSTQTEDKTDQGVQTEKLKRGFLRSCRRFFRRSFKCLNTEEE